MINVSSVSAFVVGCLYRLPADTQMSIGLPSPLYTASKKPFYIAPRSQTPAFDTWSVPDQAPAYHFRQRESFPDYSQQLVEKVLLLVDCYQQNMHTEGYSPFHSRFQEAESRSSSLLICSLFVVGHNSFSPYQQAVFRLSSLSFSCWPY